MKRKLSKADLWKLFQYGVVPSMFVAAFMKSETAQWISLGLLGAWVIAALLQTAILHAATRETKSKKNEDRESQDSEEDAENVGKTELFVIRQINHRITEQLKKNYPTVAWLWVKRPSVEELEAGGCWRIQISNAEPYNFGEVTVSETGAMTIMMIMASPLEDSEKLEEKPCEEADLETCDELDRTDAMTWYQEYGGDLLASMIDDLNTQGHKHLTLNDDGEVLVQSGKKELAVDKLEWFLPRIAWPEFTTLLKEDGITAKEDNTGLVLSW